MNGIYNLEIDLKIWGNLVYFECGILSRLLVLLMIMG